MDQGSAPVTDDGFAPPADAALQVFVDGFDQLLKTVEHGALDHYDAAQLLGFMQAFERLRNRLSLVDHRVVAMAQERDVASWACQSNLAQLLCTNLRISRAEAWRRVRAAEAVGPRRSMLGEDLDPVRPVLAAAQAEGQLSPEHVAIVDQALRSVDRRGFDPADIAAGEELLAAHARVFGPEDLRRLATSVVDAIDPDGTLPDAQLNEERRHLSLTRTKDGSWKCEGRLTGLVGAKLKAVLDPLAKVRLAPPSADGRVLADERHHGQRFHDALEDLCDQALRDGTITLPPSEPTETSTAADEPHENRSRPQPDEKGMPRTCPKPVEGPIQQRATHEPTEDTDPQPLEGGTPHTCPELVEGPIQQRPTHEPVAGTCPQPLEGGTPHTCPELVEGSIQQCATHDHSADSDETGDDESSTDRISDGGSDHDAVMSPPRTGSRAAPATLIVTIDLDDLLDRTGHGHTSDGTPLTTAEILELAAEADIIPACLNATGKLVDLGRTRRLASPHQTLALTARDGGCSFPSCDRDPKWCERHHVTAWIDGGQTNLDNLTLLCRYHHHNFAAKGWQCRITADGIPEWTPPRWVDREQRPLVNHRILTRQRSRELKKERIARQRT